jgi:hypothetical protein
MLMGNARPGGVGSGFGVLGLGVGNMGDGRTYLDEGSGGRRGGVHSRHEVLGSGVWAWQAPWMCSGCGIIAVGNAVRARESNVAVVSLTADGMQV